MKFNKKYISGVFPYIIAIAFVVAFGITFFMVKAMTIDYNELQSMKSIIENDSVAIPAKRGNILASDGQVMASSLPNYAPRIDFCSGFSQQFVDSNLIKTRDDSIVMDAKQTLFFDKLDSICMGLNEICPIMTSKQYHDYLMAGWNNKKRDYEIFPHQVLNYVQFQKLVTLPFFKYYETKKYTVGLKPNERNNRQHPFGSLAKRTLGDMYGAMDSAKCGLEYVYNTTLRGKQGIGHQKKIRDQFPIITDIAAEDGSDIVTTLDVEMQDICETALKARLKQLNSLWGLVILMEASTGDVKAIVNLERKGEDYVETVNYALTAMMEPGSTFKTASVMVAMNDGLLKMDDTVDTGNGICHWYGATMTDCSAKSGGSHVITTEEAIMKSSNIGISTLINSCYEKDPQKYIDGLYEIGIIDTLGARFNGIPAPRVLKPSSKYWSKISLRWSSIGYNNQIPPINTVTFYNAIANNGRMMRPRFVKAIQKNGKIIQEFPPEVMREEICNEQVLKSIRKALFRVVNDRGGTGKAAGSKTVNISGKTGTAQVVTEAGGYKSGKRQYFVSFCGFFPSENPQYTCIVAIRNEGTGSGGTMAGPVFAKIAENIYINKPTEDLTLAVDSLTNHTPSVKNGNLYYLQNVLNEFNISTSGKKVDRECWGTAHINGSRLNLSSYATDSDSFPDLTGMGARDAVYAIQKRGMRARISGVGKVVDQSVKPGEKIVKNKIVNLKLDY